VINTAPEELTHNDHLRQVPWTNFTRTSWPSRDRTWDLSPTNEVVTTQPTSCRVHTLFLMGVVYEPQESCRVEGLVPEKEMVSCPTFVSSEP